MSAASLTAQDVTTLLLGLDLLERFATGEMAQARRGGRNLAKIAAMQAMLEHIEKLRSKLRASRD